MRQRETEREALFVAQNDRNGPHLSLSRRRMMLCRRVCAMSIASISQPSFHSSHRRMPPTAKMRCISSGSRRRRLSGRRQRMERTYEQGTTQHGLQTQLLAGCDGLERNNKVSVCAFRNPIRNTIFRRVRRSPQRLLCRTAQTASMSVFHHRRMRMAAFYGRFVGHSLTRPPEP